VQCAGTAAQGEEEPLREIFVHSGSIADVIPDLDDLVGKVARFMIHDYSDRAAAEAAPAGPRHQRRVDELRRLVEGYSAPVRAVLRSDEATEVMVYKVGRLGTFAERALELRPGTYTVVGSRRGYRDVRRQLVVEPGREPEPLVVRCEEKI